MHSFRIAILAMLLFCASTTLAQDQNDESQTVVLFKSGAVMRGDIEFSADSSRILITRAGDSMQFKFKTREIFKVTDEAHLVESREELRSLPPERTGLRLFGSCQIGMITEARDYSGHLFYDLGVMLTPRTAFVIEALHELGDSPSNFLGLGLRHALSTERVHIYLKGGANIETKEKALGFDAGLGVRVGLTDMAALDISVGGGTYNSDELVTKNTHNGSTLKIPQDPQTSLYFRLGFSFTGSE